MKQFISTLLLSTSAFASDGQSTGCFGLAVSVPKIYQSSGPSGSAFIATKGTLCVKEKNMSTTGPEQTRVGDISIRLYDGSKLVAKYSLGAAFSEGAAGTIYTTYGRTVADVEDSSPENKYKVLIFAMRNDHIPKGQIAGRVELAGTQLTLIQK